MNIGIDIDDTITNSSDVFIKYVKKFNRKYKIKHKINKYKLDQYIAFGWDKSMQQTFKRKYLSSILKNAKVNKNCVKVINYMRKKGYKIFLITARSDSELTKLVNNLDFINKWQLFKYIPTGKFGTKNKEIYDITTEQFNKFKDIVKSNYISNDKLQFKDENVRSKAYMMVDNSGNAWIPCYNNNKTNNERNIIGNIKNKNDWENIVYYLDTNKERRCIYE